MAAVPLSLSQISEQAAVHRLEVMGGFVCADEPNLPSGTRCLILLGPASTGYWPHVTASREWQDGGADPIDRWSRRVIGDLATRLGATPFFPFGGAPYHPFYQWALRTGRVWDSPVRLLVHADHGLMVSFRGALALQEEIDVPPAVKPCDACAAPCISACPAGALSKAGYDVSRCHAFLDQPAGADCMNLGCGVRRACPLPASRARLVKHSAYHMGMFHK